MPIHNLTKYYNHVSVRESQRMNWFKRPGATLPVCYEPARDTTRIVSLDKHFVYFDICSIFIL